MYCCRAYVLLMICRILQTPLCYNQISPDILKIFTDLQLTYQQPPITSY